MSKITTNEAFRESLSSLTLAQQRAVSARFIANVLDLAHDSCIKEAQAILSKIDDISAADLENAYRAAHSVYLHTSPRSHCTRLPGPIFHCWITRNNQNILSPRPACTALHQRIMKPKNTTWPRECRCTALWRGPVPALIMRKTRVSGKHLICKVRITSSFCWVYYENINTGSMHNTGCS